MDPIANMLTTLLNASRVGKKRAVIPYARFTEHMLMLLQRKGLVAKVRVKEDAKRTLLVTLAFPDGHPALSGARRLSKPGRRVYARSSEIPYSFDGRGLIIVSTPRGLLDDREARRSHIGGELMCEVW